MEDRVIATGQLRHPIKIQSRVDVADGQGGFTRTWQTITGGACWGSIETSSAREAYSYQQLQMRVTHKIKTRYVSGVTADMQVLYGTRAFNIRSIRNVDERNKVLILLCEEGIPA